MPSPHIEETSHRPFRDFLILFVCPWELGSEICAAVNRTNINVQILTVDAALTGRKDLVYQAALLDPHTAGELAMDDIVKLCDDLFEAHGEMIAAMG
jgi:alpha-galactosidase/6-phospho-beta-glucosidase family protein